MRGGDGLVNGSDAVLLALACCKALGLLCEFFGCVRSRRRCGRAHSSVVHAGVLRPYLELTPMALHPLSVILKWGLIYPLLDAR